jgi:hypothetical protein
VRPVREPGLVIRFQQEAHHLASQLIRPAGDGGFILPLLSWCVGIFSFPGV